MAADLWTRVLHGTSYAIPCPPFPASNSPAPVQHSTLDEACRQLGNYIYHCHLLLVSVNADTQSTVPRRAEGLSQSRWLHTLTVYLPALPQAITHPNSIWARCQLTLLINANVLTTAPHRWTAASVSVSFSPYAVSASTVLYYVNLVPPTRW